MSDIFLVCRLNIKAGIPDRFYILGASAFVEAIAQFKVLPFSIMLSQLCPPGSEASLLAFFMSCHCLALIVSGYTGTMLASFLNLSVDSFVGLPLGILIQSLAALLPLLWISCIPSNLNKRVLFWVRLSKVSCQTLVDTMGSVYVTELYNCITWVHNSILKPNHCTNFLAKLRWYVYHRNGMIYRIKYITLYIALLHIGLWWPKV